MRARILICFFLLLFCLFSKAQVDTSYQAAYNYLSRMLENEYPHSFKKAVFSVENAYYDNKLSFNSFQRRIDEVVLLVKAWRKYNIMNDYAYSDSLNFYMNMAIAKVMKDTIKINIAGNKAYKLFPYSYDFDDFFGKKDWAKTFVTKLLKSNSGNCHSLPYLYKIVADELGITNAWLSFSPNHIYIKNHCQKIGWYNTELTSGQFPVDAWIMASGYVSPDAIRSGIYMDTISNQQAIANCVFDLAKGYEKKYKIYTDSFIVRCCDLTLKYHPNNINTIIYKAEILKKMYLVYKKENPTTASIIYRDMEKLYVQALDLGYKEMPERMYRAWLESVTKQQNKYTNKRLKTALQTKH